MQTWTNEASLLHQWAEDRFQPIDLVASWTTLVETYKQLEFLDQLDDEARIKEFKQVTKECNRALTRYRNAVQKCFTIEAAIEYLKSQFKAGRQADVVSRPDIAYQSLKVSLLRTCIQELEYTHQQLSMIEEEDDDDR